MTNDANIAAGSHPAPQRDRLSLAVLALILLAPPAAWALDLFWKYAVTSYVCFPGDAPLRAAPAAWGWVWASLLTADVVALALAATTAWISYDAWTRVRREVPGHAEHLAEIGEGRTRFLAFWGMLIALLVGVAIVFSFVADVGLSLCA
jgi:hypothetical protein